jgi:5'(3')-deoxyribonucleotidase
VKISRVLIDLDCVLADFVGGCAAAWGLRADDLYPHWLVGEYGMNVPLQRTLQATGHPDWPHDRVMTDGAFWGRLNERPEFWADLPKLPWVDELVQIVESYTADWHVVTSPSWCPSSYAGKVTWLKREFGKRFDRFMITPHKEILSMPGVVLIDDYEGNCLKFTVRDLYDGERFKMRAPRGGHAILFPAHHNGRHAEKADPLAAVKRDLAALSGA